MKIIIVEMKWNNNDNDEIIIMKWVMKMKKMKWRAKIMAKW